MQTASVWLLCWRRCYASVPGQPLAFLLREQFFQLRLAPAGAAAAVTTFSIDDGLRRVGTKKFGTPATGMFGKAPFNIGADAGIQAAIATAHHVNMPIQRWRWWVTRRRRHQRVRRRHQRVCRRHRIIRRRQRPVRQHAGSPSPVHSRRTLPPTTPWPDRAG